jgi:hypothetical protein
VNRPDPYADDAVVAKMTRHTFRYPLQVATSATDHATIQTARLG